MADADFKLCDVCSARCDKETRLYIGTGWSPCPAGGPSEEDREIIDLCPNHLAQAVMLLLKNKNKTNDHERGKELTEWVERCHQKNKKQN